MSLLRRALKSMRYHRIATSMLFFYDFIFLSCLLLLGCFILYLHFSTEQLHNTVNTIREYDTSLYAQPFEKLVSKTSSLFLNTQFLFTLFIFIGFINILCIQLILFHFRKQEYRSYLLLNEQSSKLYHQITLEQLMVLNLALMSLFMLYVFFQSYLFDFLSQIESSILVNHSPKIDNMATSSISEPTTVLDGQGFTRFHIDSFFFGAKNDTLFNLAVRHQFPIIALLLNIVSYVLIYFSNLCIFYVKHKRIS